MLNFKTNHKQAALKELICHADAILIGAGAGLSASAGLTYSGERFEQNFADFRQKYGISDMYSGGFYPMIPWRNIGHGGRGKSISTGTTSHPAGHIGSCGS